MATCLIKWIFFFRYQKLALWNFISKSSVLLPLENKLVIILCYGNALIEQSGKKITKFFWIYSTVQVIYYHGFYEFEYWHHSFVFTSVSFSLFVSYKSIYSTFKLQKIFHFWPVNVAVTTLVGIVFWPLMMLILRSNILNW